MKEDIVPLKPVRPATVESPFESDQRAEPNAPPDIGNHRWTITVASEPQWLKSGLLGFTVNTRQTLRESSDG